MQRYNWQFARPDLQGVNWQVSFLSLFEGVIFPILGDKMETRQTKKQVGARELELQKDRIYLTYSIFLFFFIEVINTKIRLHIESIYQ